MTGTGVSRRIGKTSGQEVMRGEGGGEDGKNEEVKGFVSDSQTCYIRTL